MKLVEHKIGENIEIVKILGKVNKKVRSQGILFKYKSPDKPDKILDYRSPTFQTVTEVCVQLGKVPRNEVIMRCSEGCLHPIVAFGLCTECGMDLKDAEVSYSEKNVSMLHAIPQVSVSESEASELGMSDILHQLKRRKLTLVVDLDQTLIHTSTTENIPEGIPGVFHFYLSNKKFRYSTRLRPGTSEFLQDMSRLYELHVFTMGARDYADAITGFLDPDRKFFSSRILSRDECFDNHSKVPKLQALFPKGDRMVAIIDDRFDMWINCHNLIRVNPYNFFEDVGDINDPHMKKHKRSLSQAHGGVEPAQFKRNKPLDTEQASFCFRTAKNNLSYIESTPLLDDNSFNYLKVFQTLRTLLLDGSFELSLLHLKHVSEKLKIPTPPSDSENDSQELNTIDTQELKEELECAMDTQESVSTEPETQDSAEPPVKPPSGINADKEYEAIIKSLCDEEDHVKALSHFYMKYVENGAERQKERDDAKRASPVFKLYNEKALNDQDRYLDTLGGLLTKIHEKFYDQYKETVELDKLPDTKSIIPELREVLRGCYIVFSGIIPTNFPKPQNHPIWCAAQQMGANVSMTLVKSGEKKTTHLVTSRADTGKVHQALKFDVKIVTDRWLWSCFEVWQYLPTKTFEWQGLTGGKRARSPEPVLEELRAELESTIGGSVLDAMKSEVDDILENGSDSDYSSPTDSEDSSEAESMESNDLTGPPAAVPQTRKRTRSEAEAGEEVAQKGDDCDSDHSLEGDLVDELEQEFTDQLNEALEEEWHGTDS